MPNPHLEHNVAVSLIELAMEGLLHQHRHEVLDLPDGQTRQLAHVLREELRVVKAWLLQALVPAPCLAPRGSGINTLLGSQSKAWLAFIQPLSLASLFATHLRTFAQAILATQDPLSLLA